MKTKTEQKPDFLPIDKAAEALGLPTEYLAELVADNVLPGIETGGAFFVDLNQARRKLHELAEGWRW